MTPTTTTPTTPTARQAIEAVRRVWPTLLTHPFAEAVRGLIAALEAETKRAEEAEAKAEKFRAAAESAMHCLLYVDAHMNDRVEEAKGIAVTIGHPWPPYDDEDDEESDGEA